MRERLEKRLQELRAEFESGQRMLADLEQQRLNLEKTMLRISGAIQVLEEELGRETEAGRAADDKISAGLNGHHSAMQAQN